MTLPAEPVVTAPLAAPLVALSHADAQIRPSEAAPLTLDYSSHTDAAALQALRPALGYLLTVAVLSGLCVGSCFLAMSGHPAAIVLHVILYAAILGVAVRGGIAMTRAGYRDSVRMVLDTLAGVGLIVVALGPPAVKLDQTFTDPASPGTLILGTAFALMGLTSYRHRSLYGTLAAPLRDAGYRKTAVTFVVLGWSKVVYETLWLLCCAAPLIMYSAIFNTSQRSTPDLVILPLFGAFFGCFGYAVIWILMIVFHSRAFVLSGRRAASAFEVLV